MKPSLQIRLLEACLLLALAGGAVALWSRDSDAERIDETKPASVLLPSPPEVYRNAYSNLVLNSYQWARVRPDVPQGMDILSFASSTTNDMESAIALESIIKTDLDRSIPLLTALATNGSIRGQARRLGVYSSIRTCIRYPSRVSSWTGETTDAFLSFAQWAVDNDTYRWCQNDAHWILFEFKPGWAKSPHRRSVLLRWLANAVSDSEREGLRRQLETMHTLPADGWNFDAIEIIE